MLAGSDIVEYSTRIAHELTRMLFGFRRDGLLETVGPAGTSSNLLIFIVYNRRFWNRCEYHEHDVSGPKQTPSLFLRSYNPC